MTVIELVVLGVVALGVVVFCLLLLFAFGSAAHHDNWPD